MIKKNMKSINILTLCIFASAIVAVHGYKLLSRCTSASHYTQGSCSGNTNNACTVEINPRGKCESAIMVSDGLLICDVKPGDSPTIIGKLGMGFCLGTNCHYTNIINWNVVPYCETIELLAGR